MHRRPRFSFRLAGVLPVFVALQVAALGCVPATNPFDPETPPEQQARGALVGEVVLQDATAPLSAIVGELGALSVVLAGQDGRAITLADGRVVSAETEVKETDASAALTFSFLELVPGRYTVRVEGYGGRYLPPSIPVVDVAPGAVVDLGPLVFATSDAGGPGRIEGAVRLEGAAGGARSVELYRLVGGGAELYATARTDIDGAFRFGGLPVGRYALVSSLEGFTPDHRLDIDVGEQEGARLTHTFSGESALVLHPVTAVVLPAVQQTEGVFYTRDDEVPVSVLAFGGVTSMRLATDPGFLDEDGAPLDFSPYSASAVIPLPDRQGPISLYAQLEARSESGFVFVSPTFEAEVVRDVTAPVVVTAAPPGVPRNADGSYFITGEVASVTLDIAANDTHSAIAGALVTQPEDGVAPDPSGLAFVDVTSAGGAVQINQPVPLFAGEGVRTAFVFVRDRAGNVSAPFEVPLVVDTGLDPLPLVVTNAVDGQLRIRTASLAFDETGAEELPVAMKVGVAPLGPGADVVPYASSFDVSVDAAHGTVLELEATLYDVAGNEVTVRTAPVVVSLTADVTGRVSLEGVPTLRVDHAGARVRLMRGSDPLASPVAEALTASDGTFSFLEVPEGSDYRIVVEAPGYTRIEQLLPALLANTALQVPALSARLARGELAGRFLLADQQQSPDAHGGILVVATLGGLDRRLVLTAVTTPDGSWRIPDVPVTRVGETWALEGVAQGYARGSAGDLAVSEGAVTVAQPDPTDPTVALPVLLQPNAGDFDLCAPTGTCVPLPYTNLDTLRVRLRSSSGVEQVRVRARVPFDEDDVEPAFVDFDVLNEPTVDVSGPDGVVEVYVQMVTDGTPGPVLRSSFTRDTVPPDVTAFEIEPSAHALDPEFTRETLVRARIDADAGSGSVAPLGNAYLAFADAVPSTPPAGATLCVHGAACDVPLPSVGGVVEERAFTLHGFACDVAGNCSPSPASARVVHDRTPPSALHGVALSATGTGIVTHGGETFTRSPSTRARLEVGLARTGAGDEVRNLDDEPVADFVAFRLGLDPLLQGAQLQVLEGALVPNASRDVAAPPLPAEDGAYRIYGQLVDAAGNRTALEPNPFFYDLFLDATPPSVGFRLADGAATTRSEAVPLTVTADPLDRPVRVWLATDDGLFESYTERTFPFAPGEDVFTLPGTEDGTYTVFARFFDAAGNFVDRQDSIRLDRTPPLVRGVTCEACKQVDGRLYTNAADRQVVLDVDAVDVGGALGVLRVQVGDGAVQELPYGVPFALTLPSDGEHLIAVSAVDDAGNASAALLTAVTLDRVPPSLSVRINDDASHTRSPDVVVSVDAADGVSGLHTVRFSTSAAFTGSPQPFVESAPVRLESPGVDGAKSVYVEVRDAAGNLAVASDTIVLDQAVPAGSVVLDGGADYTADRSVLVELTFPADTDGYAIAEAALDCAAATYTVSSGTSAQLPSFSLSAGDGVKTVVACLRDQAGNTATASASIVLDETLPEAAVSIESGAATTRTPTVGISISASADTREMSISTSAAPLDCAAASYEPFAASRTITLPAGDGPKTVQACLRDAAGNTQRATSTILLDATAPSLALSLDGGATHTNALTATASLTASADVTSMALSTGAAFDCASAVYEAFQSSRVVPLPAGEGAKTVRACVKDAAGNTAAAQASITVDTVAPVVTPVVGGGESRVGDASTTLTATVTEAVVYAVGVGGLDCASASYSATFVGAIPSTELALAPVDGTQRVVVCVKDRAGNVGAADATLELDTTAPSATLRIGDGGSHVSQADVTVFFADASSDASSVHLSPSVLDSCDDVAEASFVAFEAAKALTLPGGDGLKQVSACVRDDVDNRRLLGPVGVTLDRAPPSASAGLRVHDRVRSVNVASGQASRDAQPQFSWNESVDAHGGPVRYTFELSSDGFSTVELSVDVGEERSYTPPGELTSRAWSWRVSARDLAGHVTTSAVFPFRVDRIAPQAPVLEPVEAYANGSFTASWSPADDDTARYRVELVRGIAPGVEVFAETTSSTSRNLVAGTDLVSNTQIGTLHRLRVRAVDSVGNESAATVASFVYDDAAPCQGSAALQLNNGQGILGSVQLTNDGTVLVQVRCVGENARRMRVDCDGTDVDSQSDVAFQSAFTCALDTSSQGNKRITVGLYDEAGNARVIPTQSIFFDDVRPSTPRFSAPPSVTGSASIALSALALPSLDPGASASGLGAQPYEVRATAHGAPLSWDGSSSLNVNLVEGDNTLRVRAVDRAGNSSDEDLVIVRRDTSRPIITDLVAEAGNGDVLITWDSPDDDVKRFEVFYGPVYSFDADDYTGNNADQGFSPVEVGTAKALRLTGLPNGTPLYVAVRAHDDVGPGALGTLNTELTPNEVPLIRASATPMSGEGRARGVAYADGVAFVAFGCDNAATCAHSGLAAYDLSDPANPVLLGSYRSSSGVGARALDIEVLGDRAYVSDGQYIRVFNIADPTAITLAASTYLLNVHAGADFATALAARPGQLFVAAEREGLLIYNITATGTLSLVGRYNPPCTGDCLFREKGRAVSVAVQGSYAYVGNGEYFTGPRALEVVDISNLAAPVRAGTGSLRPLTAWDIEFHGANLYFAQNLGVRVHAVPGGPLDDHELADDAVARSSGQPRAITVAGPYAYIADSESASEIRVVSTGERPETNREMPIVGKVRTGAHGFHYICDVGGTLVVRSQSCVPQRLQTTSSRLTVAGNLLLEANDTDGFVVYRIGRPVRAREVAHLPLATDGNAGAAENGLGLAYRGRNLVQAGRGGLGLFRVDAPEDPVVLGSLVMPVAHHVLAQVDDTLYVAREDELAIYRYSAGGGTSALSLDEGWRIQDLGTIPYGVAKEASALYVRWPHAYVLVADPAGADTELLVLDVRTGARVGAVAMPGGVGGRDGTIAYHRNRLYIARSAASEVTVVDISSRAAPVVDGSFSSGSASGAVIQGTQLFVGGYGATRIYDLGTSLSSPPLLGSVTAGGATLAVSGDHVFGAREPQPVIIHALDPTAPRVIAQPGRIRYEEGVLVVGKHMFVQDRTELSVIELQ